MRLRRGTSALSHLVPVFAYTNPMLAELLLKWPLIRQLKSGADGTGVDDVDWAVVVDVLDVVMAGENRQRMVVTGCVERPRERLGEPVLMNHHNVGALRDRVEPSDQMPVRVRDRLLGVGQLPEREDAVGIVGVCALVLQGVIESGYP